jgi:hypothetical protein
LPISIFRIRFSALVAWRQWASSLTPPGDGPLSVLNSIQGEIMSHKHIKRVSLLAITTVLFAIATSAHATDGVIEINHARALAGGITLGDNMGYPVTISRPGSYRLTSNLSQPDANTNVINITADNVTLDLNGFTISGTNVCSVTGSFPNWGMSCPGAGTGVGVSAPGHGGVSVVNGNITGMGSACIHMAGMNLTSSPQAQRVDNVHVSHCGDAGIQLNDGSNGSVAHSSANYCWGEGIVANKAFDNTATENSGNGLRLLGGVARGNNLSNNQGNGIFVTRNSVVIGNTTRWNAGYGVDTASHPLNPIVFTQNVLEANSAGHIAPGAGVNSLPPNSNLCGGTPC